jgi:hypothetical protein
VLHCSVQEVYAKLTWSASGPASQPASQPASDRAEAASKHSLGITVGAPAATRRHAVLGGTEDQKIMKMSLRPVPSTKYVRATQTTCRLCQALPGPATRLGLPPSTVNGRVLASLADGRPSFSAPPRIWIGHFSVFLTRDSCTPVAMALMHSTIDRAPECGKREALARRHSLNSRLLDHGSQWPAAANGLPDPLVPGLARPLPLLSSPLLSSPLSSPLLFNTVNTTVLCTSHSVLRPTATNRPCGSPRGRARVASQPPSSHCTQCGAGALGSTSGLLPAE